MNENSEYIITTDTAGKLLHGENNHRLHMPQCIPSCNFWSVIVYDSQTGLIISTDQPWPSVHSNCKNLHYNDDGSVDILFGPVAPENIERNWIKTIPGKEWHLIVRIYDPIESGFDKSWKPGEVEELI